METTLKNIELINDYFEVDNVKHSTLFGCVDILKDDLIKILKIDAVEHSSIRNDLTFILETFEKLMDDVENVRKSA